MYSESKGTAGAASPSSPRNDHQWEETYLGLLWVAMWKLPPARHSLLLPSASSASSSLCHAPGPTRLAPVFGEPAGGGGVGGGGVSRDGVLRDGVVGDGGSDRQGLAAFPRRGSGKARDGAPGDEPVPRGDGASPLVIVAAVLRRLYHPRPSVRRLASRIAVRLAFDARCFFSPLSGLPPPPRASAACGDRGGGRGEGGGRGGCCECGGGCASRANGADGDDSGVDSGNHPDVFAVPTIVLRAYPRLVEWSTSVGSDALLDAVSTVSAIDMPREMRRNGGSKADFSRAGGPRLVELNDRPGGGSAGDGGGDGSKGGGSNYCADGCGREVGTRCCHRAGAVRGSLDVCCLNDSSSGGDGGSSTGDVPATTTQYRCVAVSAVYGSPGVGGDGTAMPGFVRLAPGEWELLTRKRNRGGVSEALARRSERGGAGEEPVSVVVDSLVEALRRAGRRSEFSAAMSVTRAWMLAGPG